MHEKPAPTEAINPFFSVAREILNNPESTDCNIAIIAIDGQRGAGVTSVAQDLAKIVRQKTGQQSVVLSFEEELQNARKEAAQTIGIKSELDIYREVHRKMAMLMMSPANNGKLVIAEGHHMPFIARELELAAARIDNQAIEEFRALAYDKPILLSEVERGKGVGKHFPATILTTYIFADPETRYRRLYGEGVTGESLREGMEKLKEAESDSLKRFWNAYPEQTGDDPASINFTLSGKNLYDLYFDSEEHASSELAGQIFGCTDFREKLMPIFVHQQE